MNVQSHPRENLINFQISRCKMAEQDRNYLPLPHGCAGSRERSSQGQMSSHKEKGPEIVPICSRAADLSPSRAFPLFPHRLPLGGESPSVSCTLEAKTQRLLKGFEGDKP